MIRRAALLTVLFLCASEPAHALELLLGSPTRLEGPVNTSKSDFVHPSRDGSSLYVSQGPNFAPAALSIAHGLSLNDSWESFDIMDGKINDGGSVGIVSTTVDGLSMFFSGKISFWNGGVRPGGLGEGDIWVTERSSPGSSFGDPTNVGAPINTKYLESDPSISADGLTMVFASDRPDEFGSRQMDLWEARRANMDAPWEEPQNLGAHVNSGDRHMTPALSADGLTAIYAVAGNGRSADLSLVTRKDVDSPWSAPVSLGGKINTSQNVEFNPQLSADGATLYYSQWTDSQEFDVFEVPLLPFETVPLIAGSESYTQDFDTALGIDGKATGTVLPTGWTVSDNETVFSNATNLGFPVSRSLGADGNPILNAGADGDRDRALAIGAKDLVDGGVIQLLADVVDSGATSVQLQFDVEAWDASTLRRTDDPGEAAFEVHVDIDRGDGYETLANLGRVTTGALNKPTGAYLDGNVAENRVSFDSGQIDGSIPAGSKLRVHWHVDRDAQTNNWVFGLDNVSVTLLDNSVAVDIDALSAEVRAGTNDPFFDLNSDGLVDDADRTTWLQDVARTFYGDADLNGEVNFGDFLALSNAFGGDGGWSAGDFDGNGAVEFSDFLLLSDNFGKTTIGAAAVPEPNGFVLGWLGLLGFVTLRRHSRADHR